MCDIGLQVARWHHIDIAAEEYGEFTLETDEVEQGHVVVEVNEKIHITGLAFVATCHTAEQPHIASTPSSGRRHDLLSLLPDPPILKAAAHFFGARLDRHP